MFSRSLVDSSSTRSKQSARGFTLVELLISTAIITIITAIVLVRYGTFDSVTLLKSLAYEVGLTIREAQVYSVSVSDVNQSGNYRYPYGLNFVVASEAYTLFRYTNNDTSVRPIYGSGNTDDVRVYRLTNGVSINDVCVWIAGGTSFDCASTGTNDSALRQLDISFRRPEFAAIFNAHWLAAGVQDTIESARIEVVSPTNTNNIWVVDINLLGQISINKKI
jgi:prepilin-type N-terminal cleavage/methylation domain-containing protein